MSSGLGNTPNPKLASVVGSDKSLPKREVRIHQDAYINDLAHLPSPKGRFRLDRLLLPGSLDETIRNGRNRFETIESCIADDQQRSLALNSVTAADRAKHTSEADLSKLPKLLGDLSRGEDSWSYHLTRASALSMRELRLRFLGAILQLAHNYSSTPAAFIMATGSSFRWRFGVRDAFWHDSYFTVPRLFRSCLRIGGVMDAPGYLIAYLHAQFDPTLYAFQLQYRGICGGEKLEYFRHLLQALAAPHNKPLIWDYMDGHFDDMKIGVHKITKLERQIGILMPSTATMRVECDGKLQLVRRPSEAHHTAYLQWAHLYRHQPVVVMSGVGISSSTAGNGHSLCLIAND